MTGTTDAQETLPANAERAMRDAWLAMRWGLGLGDDESAYEELLRRYAEPHRRYHTATHVVACVRTFEGLRDLAERPAEVLAALLYHDAIYDPQRSDNEARSAELARDALARGGANADVAERVASYVLATQTHAHAIGDATLVVDVDDAILGSPAPTFDAYERAVAEELAVFPPELYASGRRAFLESLLARERIFLTDRMHERLDARARANVERSLRAL